MTTCEICGRQFASAGTIGEALAGVEPNPDDGRGGCCSVACTFRGFMRRMDGQCIRCGSPVDPPDPRQKFCVDCRTIPAPPAINPDVAPTAADPCVMTVGRKHGWVIIQSEGNAQVEPNFWALTPAEARTLAAKIVDLADACDKDTTERGPLQ